MTETEKLQIRGAEEETSSRDNEESRLGIPEELPILPLKNTVVFPLTVVSLAVQKPRSVRLVDDVVLRDKLIGLVALKNPETEEPGPGHVYEIGTMAVIHRLARAPDGSLHIIVQGLERIRITNFTQRDPYMRASVEPVRESVGESVELEALHRSTLDLFRRQVELAAYLPEETVAAALNTDDSRQLAYVVATSTRMDMAVKQEILALDDVADKLRRLIQVLSREVAVLELGKKIQSDAQSGMEKVQREYYLREQLKAIQRELGEEDEQAVEVRELGEKIEKSGMPEEAEKEARRELNRLSKLPAASAEYGVIRTYLGWLTELPWQTLTPDNLDITEARRVLDEDHYDLARIKDRILEYLAVRKLRKERAQDDEVTRGVTDTLRRDREGVILCFVGPPGVGKTSLGKSIARALGRAFVRQSLGGMRDEAEIRGHRRTYIGAMPGRIIQAIRRCGSRNPVFMLDEVDKLGSDFRGDPASALLEVLDPEQNREFRDHYLDVPFDLSQVMFITTANVLDAIPAPLRDRMEVLQLSGYTEDEKVQIAKSYLIPRQIRENGLRPEEVALDEDSIREIVRSYSREAGVRELERQIGTAFRKVAANVAEGQTDVKHVVDKDSLAEYLGKPRYYYEAVQRTQVPGVATGLAWTPAGGDILFIEATKMKGNKGFIMTGQLGDVMRESAQAALSFVRSRASDLGIDEDEFAEMDIHLHVPAGGIPKDGPSAGVTIATALVSLLREEPINGTVGMTGEITLRGQVLPVGGIKEKVLAAHRAGLKTVCLPARNIKDLDEIPDDVRQTTRFVLVDKVDQVFEAAFDGWEGMQSGKTEEKSLE